MPTPSDHLLRAGTRLDVPLLGPIEESGNRQFVEAGHPEFDDGVTIPIEVAERSVDERRLIVAEVDGLVVGWAQWSRSGGERCLGQISVLPEYQAKGIGSALLTEVIERAVAEGVPSLVLTTQTDVVWNRPWYERFGFVVVPEREWTDEMRADTAAQSASGLDWTTRVHMRLTLTQSALSGSGVRGGATTAR